MQLAETQGRATHQYSLMYRYLQMFGLVCFGGAASANGDISAPHAQVLHKGRAG
jgi:hypothetical protein